MINLTEIISTLMDNHYSIDTNDLYYRNGLFYIIPISNVESANSIGWDHYAVYIFKLTGLEIEFYLKDRISQVFIYKKMAELGLHATFHKRTELKEETKDFVDVRPTHTHRDHCCFAWASVASIQD